jgi:DNA-binding LacI/PurR family transcriptional regulator
LICPKQSAVRATAFQIPSLTTVRQPLDKMGALAGEILLQRIHGGPNPVEVTVDPELVIRESTMAARPRVESPTKLESVET